MSARCRPARQAAFFLAHAFCIIWASTAQAKTTAIDDSGTQALEPSVSMRWKSAAPSRSGADNLMVGTTTIRVRINVTPWLHHSGGTVCEPVDVPVNKRHLDMVYSHIKYSDRGFMGSVTAESRAEDSIDMARIVFGRDFVDRNCVILGNVNVNSPLVWDATMTTALRAYARSNQAAVIVPFILGGAEHEQMAAIDDVRVGQRAA